MSLSFNPLIIPEVFCHISRFLDMKDVKSLSEVSLLFYQHSLWIKSFFWKNKLVSILNAGLGPLSTRVVLDQEKDSHVRKLVLCRLGLKEDKAAAVLLIMDSEELKRYLKAIKIFSEEISPLHKEIGLASIFRLKKRVKILSSEEIQGVFEKNRIERAIRSTCPKGSRNGLFNKRQRKNIMKNLTPEETYNYIIKTCEKLIEGTSMERDWKISTLREGETFTDEDLDQINAFMTKHCKTISNILRNIYLWEAGF